MPFRGDPSKEAATHTSEVGINRSGDGNLREYYGNNMRRDEKQSASIVTKAELPVESGDNRNAWAGHGSGNGVARTENKLRKERKRERSGGPAVNLYPVSGTSENKPEDLYPGRGTSENKPDDLYPGRRSSQNKHEVLHPGRGTSENMPEDLYPGRGTCENKLKVLHPGRGNLVERIFIFPAES
jgi:hypothetical protein